MRINAMRCRKLGVLVLAVVGLAACSARADDPTQPKYTGITSPSDQRGLNFNIPGVVSKVFVHEGDTVKKDMVVAQEDDSVDQKELLVKKSEGISKAFEVDAAVKDLAQKGVDLKRIQAMFDKKVAGQSEVEKAELDVEIGKIRVKLSQNESKLKLDEAAAIEAKIEQKKLRSTIDGDSIVQKINVHEGELATNDPKTPCLQLVSNFPLYIEVDIPIPEAKSLEQGQTMDVRYFDEKTWTEAPIIYINPVANAAAGSQRVRLKLENTKKLRSGLQVEVTQHTKLQKGVAGAQVGQ